ncbi:MAG TPA: TlpA disulfide reductase family protein [Burkholderiales bacterium]
MKLSTAVAASFGGAFALSAALLMWRAENRDTDAPRHVEAQAKSGGLLAARFPDLEGRERAFGEWKGQVLVVNFWATWCAPCREEIPLFVAMEDKYGARGLQIVGLAIDRPDPVRAFAREFGVNYPLLIGGFEAVEIMRPLGNSVGALPFSVVYDRSGQAVLAKLGAFSVDELASRIRPLFKD